MRIINKIFGIALSIAITSGGTVMVNAVKDTEKPEKTETVYAHELDAQAYTGNDLGAVYTKNATTFKVWAPTASRVAVRLYKTGSSDEKGAQDVSTTSMTKGENGVWSVRLEGDKKNLYYTYLVTIDGVTRETADIYAKAAGVNGNRSMIVDLDSTDPEGWSRDSHVLYDSPTDAVVWEVHIKDFSHSEVSGISVKHKGKYLAFTEKGTTLNDEGQYPTCIEYLKKLGVTHVQLLPVYDYATVDESDADSDEFNWGYDPKNYNVPEGSYSTDPFDGNVRINEFKQMIMALHGAGIGVIMDVVFNHTFTAKGGWFEMTVPGYYYRMTPDGDFSDGSGCGNETASDHLMYRKYMVDSILYWTNEYHIDGFRFDLMGLHDVDTMNEIRNALDTKVTDGKKIILYGEPWTGGEIGTKAKTAVKDNVKLLDSRIGVFNDEFRDAVKGHVFNAHEKGFVQSGGSKSSLIAGIGANTVKNECMKAPTQSVAYVSAHDNFTLYDKLVLSVKNDQSYALRDEQLVDMNRLSAALVLTSQGISFMQAGEEFARTKQGDENSYISPAGLNELDWNRTAEYADLVSYYSGLIELRKNFAPFRDPTSASAKSMQFTDDVEGVVAYTLENKITPDKEWSYAAAVFNGSDKQKTVTLKAAAGSTLPNEWTVVVNKTEAGIQSLGTIKGSTVTVPPYSALVLADKKSFDRLSLASESCTVRAEYRDSDTDELISSRTYKGISGSAYVTSENKSLDIYYDLERTEGNTSGNFTKEPKTVKYYYKKFSGRIIDLNVRYLKDVSEIMGGGETEAAASYTQKIREGSEYSAPVKKIGGMVPDLSRFPSNAVGQAGTENITVSYYYAVPEKTDLVLHYYSPDSAGVNAYVYQDEDGEINELTESSGSPMQPDSGLGKGWFTLRIANAGNKEELRAKFLSPDKSFSDSKVYSPSKEVWIENGAMTGTGTVNIICFDDSGKILKTSVLSGKEGTAYIVPEEELEGMRISSKPSNSSGTFSDSPEYVIYGYEPAVEEDDSKKNLLSAVMLISAAAAFCAAVMFFMSYRKRKKRIDNIQR